MLENNYFESNESKIHIESKRILFDMLVEGNIEVADNFGNTYDVYKQENETEFLHIESPTINSMNEVLFSNEDAPCVKYFKFSKDKHRLLCDTKGCYGVFEVLPCMKCIGLNLKSTEYNKTISYRPDISFGYNGVHKIWMEIVHSNHSSDKKVQFCRENNITLLEVDAKLIKDFIDNEVDKIIFTNVILTKEQLIKESEIHTKDVLDSIKMIIREDIIKNCATNGYAFWSSELVSIKFEDMIDFNKVLHTKPVNIYHEVIDELGYHMIHLNKENVYKFRKMGINFYECFPIIISNEILNKLNKIEINENEFKKFRVIKYSKYLNSSHITEIYEWAGTKYGTHKKTYGGDIVEYFICVEYKKGKKVLRTKEIYKNHEEAIYNFCMLVKQHHSDEMLDDWFKEEKYLLKDFKKYLGKI